MSPLECARSKGSLNGGRTRSTIFSCVSDPVSPSPILLSFLVHFTDMAIKEYVHANTSARIDSVTSAVITNELRRKSNEWVFYEFRGDSVVRREQRGGQGRQRRQRGGKSWLSRARRCGPNISRAELLKRYFVWIFRALRSLKTRFDNAYIVISLLWSWPSPRGEKFWWRRKVILKDLYYLVILINY